jgi:protein-tyrosine phosphatase
VNILFLCTGNTCRSPLATVIAGRLAPAHAFRSSGTRVSTEEAAAQFALEVAAEHELDLASHRAHQLEPADVQWADRIYVMEREHLTGLNGKAALLDESGIEDPYGQGIGAYRRCYDRLESAIRSRLGESGS